MNQLSHRILLFFLLMPLFCNAQESPLVGEWIGSWNYRGWNSQTKEYYNGTGKTIIRITNDGELIDVRIKEVYDGVNKAETKYWPELTLTSLSKNCIRLEYTESINNYPFTHNYVGKVEIQHIDDYLILHNTLYETTIYKGESATSEYLSVVKVRENIPGLYNSYSLLPELRLYRKGDEW